MRSERTYFVYIMTNRSRTLYTGMTNHLERRVQEHKEGLGEFTSRYKLDRLAYSERFSDVRNAIAREKQIKGWTRARKIALIVTVNPTWRDLSEDFGKPLTSEELDRVVPLHLRPPAHREPNT